MGVAMATDLTQDGMNAVQARGRSTWPGNAETRKCVAQRPPGWSAYLATRAIRGYQRWISPYKGFVCAHRKLYGGCSCSEFARLAILKRGLSAALPDILRQFADCRVAARILRRRRLVGPLAMAHPKGSGRTIDDRMYEESERKRKRLAGAPGRPHACWERGDWCLIADFGCEGLACLAWW